MGHVVLWDGTDLCKLEYSIFSVCKTHCLKKGNLFDSITCLYLVPKGPLLKNWPDVHGSRTHSCFYTAAVLHIYT